MNDQISELFALPIGLEEVINYHGIKFYGSKSLNEKVIEAIHNSKRGKPISKTVEKMIENKIILPVFADNSILSYFKRKLVQSTSGGLLRFLRILITGKEQSDDPFDYVLAFYDFNIDKIIIMVSNHLSEKFSTSTSDEALTLTLTHEMMHMFSHHFPSKCLSLFKEELNLYYFNYFNMIFDLKDNKSTKNIIESIYKYLFIKTEMKYEFNQKVILKYLNELKKFSNLSKEDFKRTQVHLIKLMSIVLYDDVTVFYDAVKRRYKYLVVPLYKAYKISFGKIPLKGCGQELIFPSELICGFSDITWNSKVISALKMLA